MKQKAVTIYYVDFFELQILVVVVVSFWCGIEKFISNNGGFSHKQ